MRTCPWCQLTEPEHMEGCVAPRLDAEDDWRPAGIWTVVGGCLGLMSLIVVAFGIGTLATLLLRP